jgi:hypothetical protein
LLPKQIQIAGVVVSIILDPTLIDTQKIAGEAIYSEQKIVLDPTVPRDLLWQHFWHEVMHWIMYIMGEDDIRHNERIIDLSAHFIKQIMDQLCPDQDINPYALVLKPE